MAKVRVLHSSSKQTALAIRCVATLKALFLSTLRYVLKTLFCFLCSVGEFIRDSDRGIFATNDEILNCENPAATKCARAKNVHVNMSVLEVKEAMVKLEESVDQVELFEEEVSLEEVRGAFEVFDENKDGFIDAEEVQKVLCALGVMEASKIECNGMIKAFDNDGDGKINFQEFIKLIENSLR